MTEALTIAGLVVLVLALCGAIIWVLLSGLRPGDLP